MLSAAPLRAIAWQLALEDGRVVEVALEPCCWAALDEVARSEGTDWMDWVRRLEATRSDRADDLAARIRVALVAWYRDRCLPETRIRRVAVRGPGRAPVMVPMEAGLWDTLAEIAHIEGESLNSLCWRMGKDARQDSALAMELRDFILRYLMQRMARRLPGAGAHCRGAGA